MTTRALPPSAAWTYSAVAQALRELVLQILGEPEHRLVAWRRTPGVSASRYGRTCERRSGGAAPGRERGEHQGKGAAATSTMKLSSSRSEGSGTMGGGYLCVDAKSAYCERAWGIANLPFSSASPAKNRRDIQKARTRGLWGLRTTIAVARRESPILRLARSLPA